MADPTNPAILRADELLLAADDRLAAYQAGYEAGVAAKVDAMAEERAREILHADAAAALGLAVRTATERHGPAWASLIEEQAAGDD